MPTQAADRQMSVNYSCYAFEISRIELTTILKRRRRELLQPGASAKRVAPGNYQEKQLRPNGAINIKVWLGRCPDQIIVETVTRGDALRACPGL